MGLIIKQFLLSARSVVVFFAMIITATIGCDANATSTDRILVRPGSETILGAFQCANIKIQPEIGKAEVVKNSDGYYIVFTSPKEQKNEVIISVEVGTQPPKLPDVACDKPIIKNYIVDIDYTPDIPSETLTKVFNVLIVAFVIALLLESAFALIFNWRLFQTFFVGKAWRTPIMFVISLLVAKHFDLDLMVDLFKTYNDAFNIGKPKSDVSINWLTSTVTAMILAGGSVGINKILIALGFRSQIGPETKLQQLNETEAWVSISVKSQKGIPNAQINVTKVDNPPQNHDSIPMMIGLAGTSKVRLKDIFFPSNTRVPPSGGYKVLTSDYYRITVFNKSDGKYYDVNGHAFNNSDDTNIKILRFGPRSIINFEIEVT